jgi:hypothetical protein
MRVYSIHVFHLLSNLSRVSLICKGEDSLKVSTCAIGWGFDARLTTLICKKKILLRNPRK